MEELFYFRKIIFSMERLNVLTMAVRDGLSIVINVIISILLFRNFGAVEVGIYALIRTTTAALECFLRLPSDRLIPRAIAADGLESEYLTKYVNVFIVQQVVIVLVIFVSLFVLLVLNLEKYLFLTAIAGSTALLRCGKIFLGYVLLGVKDFTFYNFGLISVSLVNLVLLIIVNYTIGISINNIMVILLISECIGLIIFFKSSPKIFLNIFKNFSIQDVTSTVRKELDIYKTQVLSFVNEHFITYALGYNSLEKLGVFFIFRTIAETGSRVVFSSFVNVHSVALFKEINSKIEWQKSNVIKEYWLLNGLVLFLSCGASIVLIFIILTFGIFTENSLIELILTIFFGLFSSSSLLFGQAFIGFHLPKILFQTTAEAFSITLVFTLLCILLGQSIVWAYFVNIGSTFVLRFLAFRRLN